MCGSGLRTSSIRLLMKSLQLCSWAANQANTDLQVTDLLTTIEYQVATRFELGRNHAAQQAQSNSAIDPEAARASGQLQVALSYLGPVLVKPRRAHDVDAHGRGLRVQRCHKTEGRRDDVELVLDR